MGIQKIKEEEQIDENKLMKEHLQKLDRVGQINFLSSLNEFKEELIDFLAEFAKSGKIVKRDNIVEFFDDLKVRKKRKIEDDSSASSSAYY